MPVYFLYAATDGTLTLWGHSKIERIVKTENKYTPIFFEPFEPLPRDKWVGRLTGEKVTGAKWGSGNFRYLDAIHNGYLLSLLKGEKGNEPIEQQKQNPTKYFGLRKDIMEKLQQIAIEEGRDVSELVREAVAKLIRERG